MSGVLFQGVDYRKEVGYGMSNKLDLRTGTEWYSIAQPLIMNPHPLLILFPFFEECELAL
jgi:hypothetical protein